MKTTENYGSLLRGPVDSLSLPHLESKKMDGNAGLKKSDSFKTLLKETEEKKVERPANDGTQPKGDKASKNTKDHLQKKTHSQSISTDKKRSSKTMAKSSNLGNIMPQSMSKSQTLPPGRELSGNPTSSSNLKASSSLKRPDQETEAPEQEGDVQTLEQRARPPLEKFSTNWTALPISSDPSTPSTADLSPLAPSTPATSSAPPSSWTNLSPLATSLPRGIPLQGENLHLLDDSNLSLGKSHSDELGLLENLNSPLQGEDQGSVSTADLLASPLSSSGSKGSGKLTGDFSPDSLTSLAEASLSRSQEKDLGPLSGPDLDAKLKLSLGLTSNSKASPPVKDSDSAPHLDANFGTELDSGLNSRQNSNSISSSSSTSSFIPSSLNLGLNSDSSLSSRLNYNSLFQSTQSTEDPIKMDSESNMNLNFENHLDIKSPSQNLGTLESDNQDQDTDADSTTDLAQESDSKWETSMASPLRREDLFSLSATSPSSGKVDGGALDKNMNNLQLLTQEIQYVARQGGGEARIHLNPEGLGNVHIKLEIQSGRLSIDMRAETPEAQSLLEKSIGNLKHNLESQNLSVARIQINTETFREFSSQDHQHRNPHQGQSQDFREYSRQESSFFQNGNSSRREQGYAEPGFQQWSQMERRYQTAPTHPSHISESSGSRGGSDRSRSSSMGVNASSLHWVA